MSLWAEMLHSTTSDADLVANILTILRPSPEPMPIAHIKTQLPDVFRHLDADDLAETIERQVSAQVLFRFPRYRGSQERYWHRPLRVHLENLILKALAEGPLPWHHIRRRLPDYAKGSAENVLAELLDKKRIARHPPLSSRQEPRYGLQPPDPREYLRGDLAKFLQDIQKYDLDFDDLQQGLVTLLQTEDWSHLKREKAQPGGHDSW